MNTVRYMASEHLSLCTCIEEQSLTSYVSAGVFLMNVRASISTR